MRGSERESRVQRQVREILIVRQTSDSPDEIRPELLMLPRVSTPQDLLPFLRSRSQIRSINPIQQLFRNRPNSSPIFRHVQNLSEVEDLSDEGPILNLCCREFGVGGWVWEEEVFAESSDVEACDTRVEVDFGWGGDVCAVWFKRG